MNVLERRESIISADSLADLAYFGRFPSNFFASAEMAIRTLSPFLAPAPRAFNRLVSNG